MESQREFLMITEDSSPRQYARNAVLIIFSLISNISGTKITLDCGDMYDDFYTRLENVYIETIKLLNEWGDIKLIEKFRHRLEVLVNKTEDVGWGYHDQTRAFCEQTAGLA